MIYNKSLAEALRIAANFFAEHPDMLAKGAYARDRCGNAAATANEAAHAWCFVGRVACEMGMSAPDAHIILDRVAAGMSAEFISLSTANDHCQLSEVIAYAREMADWIEANPAWEEDTW